MKEIFISITEKNDGKEVRRSQAFVSGSEAIKYITEHGYDDN